MRFWELGSFHYSQRLRVLFSLPTRWLPSLFHTSHRHLNITHPFFSLARAHTHSHPPMTVVSDHHLDSHPAEDQNGRTASLVTAPTSSGQAPSSSDNADDFLARAQALGLRLSRSDYERTRAGVTAFLKAERLPPASPYKSETSDDRASGSIEHEHARDVAPQLARWLRTTSGQLSFFTAVVHPTQTTQTSDEHRTRLSLDEVGSAEEKRRRRMRRRRLLEKHMLQESGARSPSGSASISGSGTAPVPVAGSYDDPASSSRTGSPQRPARAGSSFSHAHQHQHEPPVSLTIQSLGPSLNDDGPRVSPPGSPDVKILNRIARVDPAGKLWLAPQDPSHELLSEDSSTHAFDEQQSVADTSDDTSSHAMHSGGQRSFSRTSSGTTEQLNACMKNMSLLDRIMMSKTSPRRMRREAKARERERIQHEAIAEASSGNPGVSNVPGSHEVEPAPDTSMSSWADVSTLDSPPSKLPCTSEPHLIAPTPTTSAVASRVSHARHTSLSSSSSSSLRRSHHHLQTPSHDHRYARADALCEMSPVVSLTPLSRFDPGTQITPMRYSPGGGVDYSYSRSTLAFSPHMLTPWTHQGRLMSNAGLSNVPSSPFVSGEWSSAQPMLSSSTATLRGNFAFSSTPLSHLPSHDPDLSVPFASSPSRLQCIESFPGRSPQGRDMMISPTRKALVLSPLASKGHSRPASRSPLARRASPTTPIPAASSLSPLWRQLSSMDERSPRRRTDTIRPTDVFSSAVPSMAQSSEPSGSSPAIVSTSTPVKAPLERSRSSQAGIGAVVTATVQASLTSEASDASFPHNESPKAGSDDVADISQASASSPELRTRHGLPRVRLPRRKSASSRSSTAASSMTPMHSDDVFAKDRTPMEASFNDVFYEAVSTSDPSKTEWDLPDGRRIVKLVSEELQAALDSGSLKQEPKPRYFCLPPGYGKSKTKPSSVSYAGLIGQAILSSSDGRLSLAEIYLWISSVYPYYERGDRGWQNSIRHNLSLNKSFVKLERELTMPGKGGWWAIQPGHEHRFQQGMYLAHGGRLDTAPTRSIRPSPSVTLSDMVEDSNRKKRLPLAPCDTNVMSSTNTRDTPRLPTVKRPKTARPTKFIPTRSGAEAQQQMQQQPQQQRSASETSFVMRDGMHTPLATSPANEKLDADSFDTSTSRSLLATPGNPAATAPLMSVSHAFRSSPSMQIRHAPMAPPMPLMGMHTVSNAPNDLYARTFTNMPDCGMMYMNQEMPYGEYPVPMTSSPQKQAHFHPTTLSQPPPMTPMHMHSMQPPFTHLQAHVPVVPAGYTGYVPDQRGGGIPSSWPDALQMGLKGDATW